MWFYIRLWLLRNGPWFWPMEISEFSSGCSLLWLSSFGNAGKCHQFLLIRLLLFRATQYDRGYFEFSTTSPLHLRSRIHTPSPSSRDFSSVAPLLLPKFWSRESGNLTINFRKLIALILVPKVGLLSYTPASINRRNTQYNFCTTILFVTKLFCKANRQKVWFPHRINFYNFRFLCSRNSNKNNILSTPNGVSKARAEAGGRAKQQAYFAAWKRKL